jgi:PKD domain
MFRIIVRSIAVLALLAAIGCGDRAHTSSTFTAPTDTAAPASANRPPVIDSLSVTPEFGIAGVTAFSLAASASDPDGDPIEYAWSAAGTAFTGATGTVTFLQAGTETARLTVTDGSGLSVSDARPVTVATMAGEWRIISGPLAGATFGLSQSSGGTVTGGFSLPGIGSGATDPADPGRITADAQLTLHVALAPSTDFMMAGSMDRSGRLVSGTLQGAGLDGERFAMAKRVDVEPPCAPPRFQSCFR